MARQEDEKMISVLWAAGVCRALPHPTPNGVLGCGEAQGSVARLRRRCLAARGLGHE